MSSALIWSSQPPAGFCCSVGSKLAANVSPPPFSTHSNTNITSKAKRLSLSFRQDIGNFCPLLRPGNELNAVQTSAQALPQRFYPLLFGKAANYLLCTAVERFCNDRLLAALKNMGGQHIRKNGISVG